MKNKGLIVTDLTFTRDLYCFVAGEQYEFKPGINLFVGDQAAGKSTLISCMIEMKSIKVNVTREADYVYFDSEKHNPRVVKSLDATHHHGIDVLSGFFQSHGETLLPFIIGLKKYKNRIIFLDEPEAGLSIRSQYKVVEVLRDLVKNGCQLFIATHSLIIMEAVGEVLSLEHKKWMPAKKFIDTQK